MIRSGREVYSSLRFWTTGSKTQKFHCSMHNTHVSSLTCPAAVNGTVGLRYAVTAQTDCPVSVSVFSTPMGQLQAGALPEENPFSGPPSLLNGATQAKTKAKPQSAARHSDVTPPLHLDLVLVWPANDAINDKRNSLWVGGDLPPLRP